MNKKNETYGSIVIVNVLKKKYHRVYITRTENLEWTNNLSIIPVTSWCFIWYYSPSREKKNNNNNNKSPCMRAERECISPLAGRGSRGAPRTEATATTPGPGRPETSIKTAHRVLYYITRTRCMYLRCCCCCCWRGAAQINTGSLLYRTQVVVNEV